MSAAEPPPSSLARLAADEPLVAVELRPPRSGGSRSESMDLWIDMQHTARGLARRASLMFLTDNAVGAAEEENLRHLSSNLAGEVPPERVIPFLTCKHTLDYCLMYAARAHGQGYRALTVLGGDHTVGPPRCVAHAYELRQRIRDRVPDLTLGGWANPHRDAERQVDYLLRDDFQAAFYLTQVVSHHDLAATERFVTEATRRGVGIPGVFGVFHYRSATPSTLERLARFLPVPTEGVRRDFAAGKSPEEITAETIRALRGIGVQRVYVANLGVRGAVGRYEAIVGRV